MGYGCASCLPAMCADSDNLSEENVGILVAADRDKLN